jgi:hypothetical protein
MLVGPMGIETREIAKNDADKIATRGI